MLARDTEARLRSLSLGPSAGLLAPVERRRDRLATELDDLATTLNRGSVTAEAIADLLAGPRRYLVFAANNAEMRAGSGMWLSVAELHTGEGRIQLGEIRSVTDIPVRSAGIELERDLAARWGWLHPQEEWRNLMLSPRFEVSAALAAQMWSAAGNLPVDGVVVLDPVALQGFLHVLGPVSVTGRQIDATNVVEELLHSQYVRFPSEQDVVERRGELGIIARRVFTAIDARNSSLQQLVMAIADAARGRHILLWSSRPVEQSGWSAAGVDGGLGRDSLLVSVLNRGANKLDRYLGVSANLSFRRTRPGTEAALEILLRNDVPPGEPPSVAGPAPGSGIAAGTYTGIVAVNLPGAAREGRVEGVSKLAVAGADGPTRVVGTEVVLAPGEQRTLTVRFRLPAEEGIVVVEPSARVPAVQWTSGSQRWSDAFREEVHWQV